MIKLAHTKHTLYYGLCLSLRKNRVFSFVFTVLLRIVDNFRTGFMRAGECIYIPNFAPFTPLVVA